MRAKLTVTVWLNEDIEDPMQTVSDITRAVKETYGKDSEKVMVTYEREAEE